MPNKHQKSSKRRNFDSKSHKGERSNNFSRTHKHKRSNRDNFTKKEHTEKQHTPSSYLNKKSDSQSDHYHRVSRKDSRRHPRDNKTRKRHSKDYSKRDSRDHSRHGFRRHHEDSHRSNQIYSNKAYRDGSRTYSHYANASKHESVSHQSYSKSKNKERTSKNKGRSRRKRDHDRYQSRHKDRHTKRANSNRHNRNSKKYGSNGFHHENDAYKRIKHNDNEHVHNDKIWGDSDTWDKVWNQKDKLQDNKSQDNKQLNDNSKNIEPRDDTFQHAKLQDGQTLVDHKQHNESQQVRQDSADQTNVRVQGSKFVHQNFQEVTPEQNISIHTEPAHDNSINDLKQTVPKSQEIIHNTTPKNKDIEFQKSCDWSLPADRTKQGSSQIQLESYEPEFKDEKTMGEQSPNMIQTKAKQNSNKLLTTTPETEVFTKSVSQGFVQDTKCESKTAEMTNTAKATKSAEIPKSVTKDKASFIKEIEQLEMEYEQMLEQVTPQEVSEKTDIHAEEVEEPEAAPAEATCKPFEVSGELETIAEAEEHEEEEDRKIDSSNEDDSHEQDCSYSDLYGDIGIHDSSANFKDKDKFKNKMSSIHSLKSEKMQINGTSVDSWISLIKKNLGSNKSVLLLNSKWFTHLDSKTRDGAHNCEKVLESELEKFKEMPKLAIPVRKTNYWFLITVDVINKLIKIYGSVKKKSREVPFEAAWQIRKFIMNSCAISNKIADLKIIQYTGKYERECQRKINQKDEFDTGIHMCVNIFRVCFKKQMKYEGFKTRKMIYKALVEEDLKDFL